MMKEFMSTNKSKSKLVAQEPVVNFYVAEDLRQELNGKVSAVGLYADRVIVLQIPKSIPEPTEDKPILIKSLGFLFNIARLQNKFNFSADVETNKKIKPFIPTKEYQITAKDKSISIMAVMQPCAITSFGEKKIIAKVGAFTYKFDFEVRRESPEQLSDSNQTTTSKPKLKKSKAKASGKN